SHAADHRPDKIAIRFEGEEITYAAFEQQISRLAWVLKNTLAVATGDRIGHLAFNNPLCLALVFACARIGAILVPLNFRLAENELAYLLQDAGARVLFTDDAFAPMCANVSLLPHGCKLVALEATDLPADCICLHELMDAAPQQGSESRAANAEAPLLIVYTSGTTGQPKGVVLDHNAIRWNALNSQHMHGFTHDDHVLTLLPFFHVGGINIQTLPAFHFGATVTLQRQFDPAHVLATIVEQKPTLTVLVPTQMQALAELPQWESANLSSLRAVTTGSTLVDTTLLNIWRARGIRTLQIYGCTESSPIAINQAIDELESPLGSVGKPAKYCQVRLVDEQGEMVPVTHKGEIQLRGPNVMREYWQKPQATAASLRDGWFATGDIGYSDAAGNYFVVDRIKNMIISGGENIYPAELEQILLEHPDIEQAAVVGLPDARWGEIAAAAIVKQSASQLDAAAVLRLFEGRVGHYKHPRQIIFMPDLPRNAMGKLLYADVRSRLQTASGVSDPVS
ncbi:MAG: class I adenylate-forming enzyme family protein, partial [Pseudomonadales bacterium]